MERKTEISNKEIYKWCTDTSFFLAFDVSCFVLYKILVGKPQFPDISLSSHRLPWHIFWNSQPRNKWAPQNSKTKWNIVYETFAFQLLTTIALFATKWDERYRTSDVLNSTVSFTWFRADSHVRRKHKRIKAQVWKSAREPGQCKHNASIRRKTFLLLVLVLASYVQTGP